MAQSVQHRDLSTGAGACAATLLVGGAAIEPSPTAGDRGSGGSQEVEADEPAKAVVSVGNTELMDNDDYPRYPAEIMVMGEWLNTLAHTIIQCQRHSH
jgi:hypothetical protein